MRTRKYSSIPSTKSLHARWWHFCMKARKEKAFFADHDEEGTESGVRLPKFHHLILQFTFSKVQRSPLQIADLQCSIHLQRRAEIVYAWFRLICGLKGDRRGLKSRGQSCCRFVMS
jgi:hypothetical protein